MIKKLAFYLILVIFISHNLFFVAKMALGQQPKINTSCPLAISIVNTPLLFDRDEPFFNTQKFNLVYQHQANISLTRRDIRKGLFSYFRMLYFAHWGKYLQIPGASETILKNHFCYKNSFMYGLGLTPPDRIERLISSPHNEIVLHESFECPK